MDVSRLTSTVTKTRRLFYLYAISKFLKDRGISNFKSISNYIINFSRTNHKYLTNYKDSTGEINTNHALKRYLDLSSEIGLIKKTKNRYENTIDGTCLSYLNTTNIPYILSKPMQIYFCKLLLENDFDYLITLLKLSILDNINHASFRTEIEKILLHEPIFLNNIDVLNELKSWKKPKRYFGENIYAPRRNWLIDLDLITSKRSKGFKYILRGNRSFLSNTILNLTKNNLYDYLHSNYYTDFSRFYYPDEKLVFLKNCNHDIKYEIIYVLLEDLFKKYGYVDRISSKFLFNYGLIKLLSEKKIVAERDNVEKILQLISKKSDYRYRPVTEKKSARELIDTGYITKFL